MKRSSKMDPEIDHEDDYYLLEARKLKTWIGTSVQLTSKNLMSCRFMPFYTMVSCQDSRKQVRSLATSRATNQGLTDDWISYGFLFGIRIG
jgi:hypothetical protein